MKLTHILTLAALAVSAPAYAFVNEKADTPAAEPVPQASYTAVQSVHVAFTRCMADKGDALNGVVTVAEVNKLSAAFQDVRRAYEKPSLAEFNDAKSDWTSAKAVLASKTGC